MHFIAIATNLLKEWDGTSSYTVACPGSKFKLASSMDGSW